MEKDKILNQLLQIYRLRQLQGIIPFTWTFEEYLQFQKELWGIANGQNR